MPDDKPPQDESIDLDEIDRRTREYSTAARHASGEPARLFKSNEYREDLVLTCPECGWSGEVRKASHDYHREVFDVSCPRCEKMLIVVSMYSD